MTFYALRILVIIIQWKGGLCPLCKRQNGPPSRPSSNSSSSSWGAASNNSNGSSRVLKRNIGSLVNEMREKVQKLDADTKWDRFGKSSCHRNCSNFKELYASILVQASG
ncbi:MAG: hypothetical protein GY820_14860 [Gammaproteobacteria bacterium]|nr:hypothetical protein [Gammaproteobacteria bacterium]